MWGFNITTESPADSEKIKALMNYWEDERVFSLKLKFPVDKDWAYRIAHRLVNTYGYSIISVSSKDGLDKSKLWKVAIKNVRISK